MLPSVAKELPTGAVLQYAFADFRSEYGRVLEGVGVRPDIVVPLDRRTLLAGRDPQLEAAIDAIQPPVAYGARIVETTDGEESPLVPGETAEKMATTNRPESIEPLVEQILEKYVEAIGGRAAVEKISSRLSKGTFEGSFAGVKVSGATEILEQAPDKTITLISLPGMGVMRRAIVGTYGYEQMPFFGLRRFSRLELNETKLSADFHWPLNLKRLYASLTYRGQEKVGEMETHVVEAMSSTDVVTRLYFDTQSGLLVRRDSTNFEDYREVDGLRLPFRMRDARTLIQLTEIKHNLPLDASRFAEEKNCFTR